MSGLPRPPRLAAIDLDGTLVDSAPDLAVCIDRMMAELGLPERGADKIRLWLGNGVERLVKRALTDDMQAEPPNSLYIKALDRFLAIYGEHTAVHSRLYPGAREALDTLAEWGVPRVCITNKKRRFTLPLLEALGVAGAFERVVCGDDLPRKKPDPLPLADSAAAFGVAPAESVMLGDSVNDIEAARAAGFPCIAVRYGYNHGEDIGASGPDAVVDSLAEIRTILAPPGAAVPASR